MAVRPPDQTISDDARNDPSAEDENRKYSRLDEIEGARHRVKMGVQAVLAYLVPISIIIAFVFFWIGMFLDALQLVVAHPWLSGDQQHALNTVLFSGLIGAVVGEGVKRYL